MRKIIIFVFAFGAFLGSCGNKTQKDADDLDSTEMCILGDSVVDQLDSMANIIEQIADTTDLGEIFAKEKTTLTADQQKVKPDYFITENDLKDLNTIQQKYVALAYLSVDRQVMKLYTGQDDGGYTNAMNRLSAETNGTDEEKMKAAKNAPLTMDNVNNFYDDMKARGRLDKFYVAEAAYLVEAMYIISRNVDIYMPVIDDQTAANLCQRLATTINGVELIAANRPDMKPVVDALAPVKALNATTAAELKEQIVKANETLAKARTALLKA